MQHLAPNTEQWNAAEDLRLARERLMLAMDASQMALWDTDIATGSVWLSEAWAQLLGLPAAETRTADLRGLSGSVNRATYVLS